ncbi:hypothetical protein GCM10027594_09570 [Hymenobacter agri]
MPPLPYANPFAPPRPADKIVYQETLFGYKAYFWTFLDLGLIRLLNRGRLPADGPLLIG